MEPDFGLLQLGVRFHDPEVGRFTQRDPAGEGINLYAYARSRPVSVVDPKGLRSLTPRESKQVRCHLSGLLQCIGPNRGDRSVDV